VNDEALRYWLEALLGIVVATPKPVAEAARLEWVAQELRPRAFDPTAPWTLPHEPRQED